MVIESVTQTTSKTIHVINFDQKSAIKVGRAQQAEVRITDISVSRHHSTLTLNETDGSVSVSDNFSKFGTLKLMRKPLTIRDEFTPLYFQVGRAVIVLTYSDRWSFCQKLNCCWLQSKKRKNADENFLHYEESVRDFPYEFRMMFGGGYNKELYDKATQKRRQILQDHFNTQQGVKESILIGSQVDDLTNQQQIMTHEEMKTDA